MNQEDYKKIATILDREGSMVISKIQDGLTPQIRFCSKKHAELKWLSKTIGVPCRKTKENKTTLTVWAGTLAQISHEVVKYLKREHRRKQLETLMESFIIISDKEMPREHKLRACHELRVKMNAIRLEGLMGY